MARKFETMKEGDIVVMTIGDPRTKEVWTTREYKVERLVADEVYFNGDEQPRKVFNALLTDKNGSVVDSPFFDFNETEVALCMPNLVTYFLKD